MRSDAFSPSGAGDGPSEVAEPTGRWVRTGSETGGSPEPDVPRLDSSRRSATGPRASGPEMGQSSPSEDPVARVRAWLAERGVDVPAADAEPAVEAVPAADADPMVEAEPKAAGGRAPWAAAPPVGEDELSPSGPASRDPGEPDADPESLARTIVLRKLAAQARTRAELEKALQAKLVPPAAAKSVLDRMEAVGLVDDEEFARDWVASRQQRRYLSKSALRRELSGKGVPREEIDAALEGVDQDAELSAARALVSRKVRVMAELDHQVRYRRLAGMLGRRGFSPGVVSRVLDEMLLADRDPGSSH